MLRAKSQELGDVLPDCCWLWRGIIRLPPKLTHAVLCEAISFQFLQFIPTQITSSVVLELALVAGPG